MFILFCQLISYSHSLICDIQGIILSKQEGEMIVCPGQTGYVFFVHRQHQTRDPDWGGISRWRCLHWMITFLIFRGSSTLDFSSLYIQVRNFIWNHISLKFCRQTFFLGVGILFHLLVTLALSSFTQAWRVECIVWHLQFSMGYCFLIIVWGFCVGQLFAAVVVLLTGETCRVSAIVSLHLRSFTERRGTSTS